MNIDENITIIIPTKNRPKWIERCLIYYDKSKFKGKILVADSTDNNDLIKFQKVLKKNFQSIVKFINCKGLSFQPAVLKALHEVETKYVVINCDDDIIISKKLHLGLNFLEKNKDYSGFTGKALTIRTFNNLPFCNDIFLTTEKLLESEDEIPYKRFINFLQNPERAFTVTSKFLAIKAYKLVNSLDSKYLRTFYFGEIFYALVLLRAGKVRSFNFGYCIRQRHDNHLFNEFNFYKFISDRSLSKTILLLKKFLLKLSKNTRVKSSHVDLILENFYRVIFTNIFDPIKESTNIKFFIKKNLNKKLLFKIQKIYHKKVNINPEFQDYIDLVKLHKTIKFKANKTIGNKR